MEEVDVVVVVVEVGGDEVEKLLNEKVEGLFLRVGIVESGLLFFRV